MTIAIERIDEADLRVDQLPCRTHDPEVFFAESPGDIEFAKQLCGACPMRAECLAGALERREPWGVWGGEIFQAGEVIARKRPRGRPRKNPLPEQPDPTARSLDGAAA